MRKRKAKCVEANDNLMKGREQKKTRKWQVESDIEADVEDKEYQAQKRAGKRRASK